MNNTSGTECGTVARWLGAMTALFTAACTPDPECSVDNDCCTYGPAFTCDYERQCSLNPFTASDPRVLQFRQEICSGTVRPRDAGVIDAGRQDAGATCVTRPARISPSNSPPFLCGAQGAITTALMADLNQFWQSSIIACSCGPDAPMCENNAFALGYAMGGRGYVYYDPDMLQHLAFVGNTNLAAAWFIAHEVGHNIQQEFNANSVLSIARELGADCYAGYFIGWLICRGKVGRIEVDGSLRATCSTQDPLGYPWFAPSAHGTCDQRVAATISGINAYQKGVPPINACAF